MPTRILVLAAFVVCSLFGCADYSPVESPRQGAEPEAAGNIVIEVVNDRGRRAADEETAPIVTVTNEYLDPIIMQGTMNFPVIADMRATTPILFCFTATMAREGAPIAAYRHGWDILDPDDDEQWDTDWLPWDGGDVCTQSRAFFFGSHSFSLEVIDENGATTLALITINTIPNRIELFLDLRPSSCQNTFNPKSQGVFKAAILGTEAVSVREVDISSLEMPFEVKPFRTQYADVGTPTRFGTICACTESGADGYEDLVMMFRAQDVAQSLFAPGKRDVVWMQVWGKTFAGEPFELLDCVRIVGNTFEDGDGPTIITPGGLDQGATTPPELGD